MKRKNKGFTLIELLAVIVILGLLMAIAIPSVTKYITQSRKKTLTNTIGNYMSALVNEVNDMVYTFTETNTIYAVPIECIAVERGGTNPFGKWHQANDSYWAYVLVQYDDLTSSYKYGFTFKDSAGYGLYPTTQAKINEKGSQIVTGLNLSKPKNGLITTVTLLENWSNSGFKVDSSTKLKVLVAGNEDQVGDGVNTCTLVQKGDNYAQVEEEKNNNFNEYRLLNTSDAGKVFGVDLEPYIYIDMSVTPILPTGGFHHYILTQTVNVEGVNYEVQILDLCYEPEEYTHIKFGELLYDMDYPIYYKGLIYSEGDFFWGSKGWLGSGVDELEKYNFSSTTLGNEELGAYYISGFEVQFSDEILLGNWDGLNANNWNNWLYVKDK